MEPTAPAISQRRSNRATSGSVPTWHKDYTARVCVGSHLFLFTRVHAYECVCVVVRVGMWMFVRTCARVHVPTRMCSCVRACVRSCTCARVRACVCMLR